MVETRNQALNLRIKIEDEEDNNKELRRTLLSNGVSKATNNTTKKNASTHNNNLLSTSQVKLEEAKNNTLLVPPPLPMQYQLASSISQKQIEQLIHYIVDDKLTVAEAAKNINTTSYIANRYYNVYKKDPKNRIPAPFEKPTKKTVSITQDQINQFIGFIEKDKMSLEAASKKANISGSSGRRYYARYKSDTKGRIPIALKTITKTFTKKAPPITQQQVEQLIRYIVNDKLSVNEAGRKTNMSRSSATKYYTRYLNSPNLEIPIPKTVNIYRGGFCTQDQIKRLIGYIVDDKLPLQTAAIKANMGQHSANEYFKLYLNDPEHRIPVPKTISGSHFNLCTQDQINELIRCIVDDKMTVTEASMKVKIGVFTARKYYRLYLSDPDRRVPQLKRHTEDQIKSLIGYVVNEKLSVRAAAKKANVKLATAYRYYHIYKKDPEHKIPEIVCNRKYYTDAQVKKLIDYIKNEKLCIAKAASKAEMPFTTARTIMKKFNIKAVKMVPLKKASCSEVVPPKKVNSTSMPVRQNNRPMRYSSRLARLKQEQV